MAIPLVEATEVATRRGGKTKGEKYGKYASAIAKLVPWIKENIDNAPDKKIRIKNTDVAKEMGAEFEKKSPGAIYWGLKFVLFHEGIVVDTGTHKSGEKLLVMRTAGPEDRLPASLTKYIEGESEEPELPEEPVEQ